MTAPDGLTSTHRARCDVVVVGGGPAAWAISAACASAGLDVTLVTAEPEANWRATYGVWLDELPTGIQPSAIAQRWDHVTVDGARRRQLRRAYGRLDNDALASELRGRAARHGVRVHVGVAAGAAREPDGISMLTSAGAIIRAVIAIDASGHPGALMHRPLRAVPAWQVAHGIVAKFDRPPIEPGSCVLMDWRSADSTTTTAAPSFLYAMDRGDGTYLVEETVLAARHPPAIEVLAEM